MWAFDMQSDWDYIAHVIDIFEKHNAKLEVCYAELVAPQEIRLQRNATENRLRHKASKRNLELSERLLRRDDENHRCVSFEGELPFESYIKIENTDIPPDAAAQMIKERFAL